MKTKRNRPRNSGTLEKKGNLWYIRFTDTESGKRRRIPTGKTARREAEFFLGKWSAERKLTSEMGETEQKLWHVKAALEHRLAQGRARLLELNALPIEGVFESAFGGASISESTIQAYKCQVGRFAEWLGRAHPFVESASGVTREIAAEFISLGCSQWTQGFRKRALTTLNAAFKRLRRKGLVSENPFESVEAHAPRPVRKRALSKDEASRLKKAADGIGGEMKTVFYFGMFTGQRFGDCCSMKWEYVKGEPGGRWLEFAPMKTKRLGIKVTVPLDPRLEEVLGEMRKSSGGEFVTPRMAARYAKSRTAAVRSANKVFEKAGIKRLDSEGRVVVGFHSLRHTFVSVLANAGKPLAVVQSMVGHSSAKMTEYYTHASLEAQREALGALSKPEAGLTGAGIEGRIGGVDRKDFLKMTALERFMHVNPGINRDLALRVLKGALEVHLGRGALDGVPEDMLESKIDEALEALPERD